MARMLGRSRSFRVLKGHKETHQRGEGYTAPQPTPSALESDRLKAATPVTRAENRVETPDPDMLQRPRTSSGPGDRSTLFHKKVIPVHQRDDPSLELPYVGPSKSTTSLFTTQLSDQEGIIGIALGSPTMAPQHWNEPHSTDFVTQNQVVTHITSNNRYPEYDLQDIPEEAPKPKLSRWKSIFKKTAPPPRQKETFYQLAKAVHSAQRTASPDYESVRSPVQDDPGSSPHTFRSDIRPSRDKKGQELSTDTRFRALTVSSSSSVKSKSPLSRFALSPRPQGLTQSSSTQLPMVTVSKSSNSTSPQTVGDRPLLDVEIPRVQMERYSVMFSNLLQPQMMTTTTTTPTPTPTTTTTSSSLLQRRQGNTDKVKPLNGLSVKKDEHHSRDRLGRRATSPSLPAKSPGQLSLFPSTNTSRAPSPHIITNRPRPLQRSKTAPAASPSRSDFPARSIKKPAMETDYPDTPSLSTSSSPASASDRSFDSESEEITIVATPNAPPKPWRPHVQEIEPTWEIIQRQPSTVTKASALRSHPASGDSSIPQEPTPTSASAMRSPAVRSPPVRSPSVRSPSVRSPSVRSPSVRSPALQRTRSHTILTSSSPRSGGMRLETSAQATVGVARSVSVSRATRSPPADNLLSPGSAKGEGCLRPGRFGESGALTPTLVELKNRRSQRVQLVDA